MDNNVMDLDNSLCTGCGTCYKVCPKQSIEIVRSHEGYYEPIVDDTCVKCGLCKKVCYKFMNEKVEPSIYDSKGYLMYSLNEETRRKASSGGIGQELTEYAIDKGYTIVGVTYDYENENAKHIVIDNIDELDRIVGSKYIPSYTSEALEKMNKNGRYMFIGTPCQIYGIRKLVSLKKFKDVILVDFFCHGTPSLNLWDKYLELIKEENNFYNIEKVEFRDKRIDWHNFSMTLKDNTGKEYSKNFRNDKFMNCFLENVDLNSPCHDCKLRFNKINSDIRLGDFWGEKCIGDKKGTSIVLTNTNIGEEIINSLVNVHCEKVTFEDIKVSQYIKSIKVPKQEKLVRKELQTSTNLNTIHNNYVKPIMLRKKYINKFMRPINKMKKFLIRGKNEK